MRETLSKSEVFPLLHFRPKGLELIRVGVHSRFRKKQYAPIEIIRTEKKGFGVRAKEDLTALVPPSPAFSLLVYF